MDRICGKLRQAGHAVIPVALIADDEVLTQRIRAKGHDHGQDHESIQSTLACNVGVKALQGVHVIDTTDASLCEIAEKIAELCGVAKRTET